MTCTHLQISLPETVGHQFFCATQRRQADWENWAQGWGGPSILIGPSQDLLPNTSSPFI